MRAILEVSSPELKLEMAMDIGPFAAEIARKKTARRAVWRRERNWDRTLSAYASAVDRNPADAGQQLAAGGVPGGAEAGQK